MSTSAPDNKASINQTDLFMRTFKPSMRQTRSRRSDQHTEAVGPSILHRRQHKYCRNRHKQKQPSIFGPQMHEEHKGESGFEESHEEHAGKHLCAVYVLIG